jgi:hypothetical protein
MANDAIFLLGDEGFIECNREGELMFGATKEELLHKMPYQFSPDTQPGGTGSREKALELIHIASTGKSQLF